MDFVLLDDANGGLTYEQGQRACEDLGKLYKTSGYIVTLHSPTLPATLDQFLFETYLAEAGTTDGSDLSSNFALPRNKVIWLGLEGNLGDDGECGNQGKKAGEDSAEGDG